MGHRPLRRTSEVNYQVDTNRRRIESLERRRLAGRWWEPDCTPEDPPADACLGIEPPLENGWAQPAPPLEKFAFRLHTDGSLEFKGHLDPDSASSGTVAVTLPGAVAQEIDFRPANDQFFLTVLADETLARVYIDSTTGEVTIFYPVS